MSDTTEKAGAMLLVRFWIKPGHEAKVLDWLDGGHTEDVVSQPGFLTARRVELAAKDDDGWRGYASIYEVETLDAIHAMFKSDAVARWERERTETGIAPLIRTEIDWGTVENSIGR